MTIEEYQEDLRRLAQLADLILDFDIPHYLQQIQHAESVAPFLDPTLYREKARAMQEDKELLRAALPLWTIGEKLRIARAAAHQANVLETGRAVALFKELFTDKTLEE